MNTVIKRAWNKNKLVKVEDLTGMTFQAESGGHTFEISGVDDTGAAVSLSGTVEGRFLRADNAEIIISGTVSSGKVSVTLSAACYAIPGRFLLTVYVTSGGQKVAVYAATGSVVATSGTASGSIPPLVTDSVQANTGTFGSISTGDATVGGVLKETNRIANDRLSTPGWYRVCWLEGVSQYSPIGVLGALIRFNIVVYGNDGNNGNHQIDYISTYGTGNRKFVNEQSNGIDTKVDKIRCMLDGNDFYIDIHFTASSNTDVYVFWDFFTALSFLGKLTTKNLEPVADAPSGETTLAEYSFSSNGVFFGDLFTNGALLLPFLTVGDAIPSNADLHNYKTAGVYYATSSVASTLSNSGITTVPFKLIVMPGNGGVWQIELAAFSNCIIAIQYFNGSTWGGWKRLTPA